MPNSDTVKFIAMKTVFHYFTSESNSIPRPLIIISHRQKQRNTVRKVPWEYADVIPELSIQAQSTDIPNGFAYSRILLC